MQVILLSDVARVGRKFDVLDVSNGYANNYLFPRKLAEHATPSKVAELVKRKEAVAAAEEARIADIKEKLETLTKATITITEKADDQGHLFKKIRSEDIAETINKDQAIDLAKENILLDSPIHDVGTHSVDVEAAGVRVTISVVIEKE